MEAVALSRPEQTPASIAAGITDLVTLPAVYLEVRRIVNDAEAGLVDLADAVSSDPAIAARLLRVANSAAYRTLHAVGSLSQAVAILGMQRVHELALASALASVFENLPVTDVNMAGFWSRSVSCGAIARSLGIACGADDVERLFVEGLLCESGHLAMFQCAPECVSAVLARAPLTDPGVVALEQELFGFSHAQVGAALLAGWQLPERIVQVVEFHAIPHAVPHAVLGQAAQAHAIDAAACHVAWHAACSLASEQTLRERFETVDAAVFEMLGLDPAALDAAVTSGIDDAAELQELFFPSLARAG